MNKWNENSARWCIERLVSWLGFNGTFSTNRTHRTIDISKKLIPIYEKFRYIRWRYDTIRYIDIASIFQYFGYIEATLQCMKNTLRKTYCKRVQTEIHAPPTWPLQGDLPTVHHLRLYRSSAPPTGPLGVFYPCLWTLKASGCTLGRAAQPLVGPLTSVLPLSKKIYGGDDRYDIRLSQCDVRLHWRASQAKLSTCQ